MLLRGFRKIWGFGPAAIGFLVPFGFTLYLGLEGGGYGDIARGTAGIVAWWTVLIGSLTLLLPLARPDRRAILGLGILASFTVWVAIGLVWTDSTERTVVEVARLLTLLGVFTLAIWVQAPGNLERGLTAVGAAIAIIAVVALGSRVAPGIFPGDQSSASLLSEASYRLLYPVGYWNALAALMAIGLPLMVWCSAFSRRAVYRAIAGAAVPVAALTIYFTFSRGGILASLAGLMALFALTPKRVETLIRSAIPIAGSLVLIVAATARGDLADGIRGVTYREQADEMALITLLVVLLILIGQVLITQLEQRGLRLSIAPRRRTSLTAAAAFVILALGAAAVAGLLGKVSSTVKEFSSLEGPGKGSERVFSAAGSNRSAYWEAALDAADSEPVTGIGAGSYEFWWAANAEAEGFVRHAHSLPLQLLAETGPLGLLLVTALFGLLIWTGASRALRSGNPRQRSLLAASTAGVIAFMICASIDWAWEVTVLPVAALLLGAAILAPESRAANIINFSPRPASLGALSLAAITLVSTLAIAILSSATLTASETDRSRELFDAGESIAALNAVRTAEDLAPWSATPLAQEALILSSEGLPSDAMGPAREAVAREPNNWRNWLVLSGVAGRAGREEEAAKAFEKARELNPRSAIFRNQP